MNIWDHSTLSVRKFGGIEKDYYEIHKFIDSSKLFYFHVKHRLLLHNLYGIELAIRKFGDTLVNTDSHVVLIRDIVAEHLKEDLSGTVPSLHDWLIDNDSNLGNLIEIPTFNNPDLEAFVLQPMLYSNLKSSLLITLSDFGVYLTSEFLGIESAKALHACLDKNKTVKNYLQQFKFTHQWQFSPDRKELEWLKKKKNGQSI